MKTLQEKIKELTFPYDMESINAEKALQKGILDLFEAEMLEIIGKDDEISGHEPLGNTHAISNYRRQQQRATLKEKLGREDKQPIWDALNNSDA